jgi:hypothetical protein
MDVLSTYLPNVREEYLLKSCIGKHEESIVNWEQWKSLVKWDDIDKSSFRIVPFLYHSLMDAGVNDNLLNAYKGVLKKTWYNNSTMLNRMSTLIKNINEELNITPVIIKGAALNNSYYKHKGLRQMNDVDIVILELPRIVDSKIS